MYCVVAVEVCCFNIGCLFSLAVVVSVRGELWIGEVGFCSLGVNLCF